MGKRLNSRTPRYKTLDIIASYNKIYDFTRRYLIFAFAGFLSVVIILILWIWEPDVAISGDREVIGDAGYIQETGLIYPVHYFANISITFDGDNKIHGLGGPIWRSQGMRNSIDNIVQYNGIILPRQISRSAWVPKLNQEYYSEGMIRTLLEGMGQSQIDASLIQSSIQNTPRIALKGDLLSHFDIGCSTRTLFTKTFCDLKIIDSLDQRNQYDLSGHLIELQKLYIYINRSSNINLQQSRCNAMIKQYRYSAVAAMSTMFEVCSSGITHEVRSIADMIVVGKEVISNTYSSTVYQNSIMNQYKLMSIYQYLMSRIMSNEFSSAVDGSILTVYNSYITRLVHSNTIGQPYGDIISVFHNNYLIPWLDSRSSFANSEEKRITQELKKTTSTIISGDPAQGITSILSGSRIKSVSFLSEQGIDYTDTSVGNPNLSEGSGNHYSDEDTNTDNPPLTNIPNDATTNTGNTNTDNSNQTTTTGSSLDALIMKVLGVAPTSVTQRGQTIIIKYSDHNAGWFAAVDLSNGGATQLYFDSPISGATKITHPQVIFNSENRELIAAIMIDYLSNNPQ